MAITETPNGVILRLDSGKSVIITNSAMAAIMESASERAVFARSVADLLTTVECPACYQYVRLAEDGTIAEHIDIDGGRYTDAGEVCEASGFTPDGD